jgi:hypothetical protein
MEQDSMIRETEMNGRERRDARIVGRGLFGMGAGVAVAGLAYLCEEFGYDSSTMRTAICATGSAILCGSFFSMVYHAGKDLRHYSSLEEEVN